MARKKSRRHDAEDYDFEYDDEPVEYHAPAPRKKKKKARPASSAPAPAKPRRSSRRNARLVEDDVDDFDETTEARHRPKKPQRPSRRTTVRDKPVDVGSVKQNTRAKRPSSHGAALEDIAQRRSRSRRPESKRAASRAPDHDDYEDDLDDGIIEMPAPRKKRRRRDDDELALQPELDYGHDAPRTRRAAGSNRRRAAGRRARSDYYDEDDYPDSRRRGGSSGMSLETKLIVFGGGGLFIMIIVVVGIMMKIKANTRREEEALAKKRAEREQRVKAGEKLIRTLKIRPYLTKLLDDSLDDEENGVFHIKPDKNKSGTAAYAAGMEEAKSWVESNILSPLRAEPNVKCVFVLRQVTFDKDKKERPFGDRNKFTSLWNNNTDLGDGSIEIIGWRTINYKAVDSNGKTLYSFNVDDVNKTTGVSAEIHLLLSD